MISKFICLLSFFIIVLSVLFYLDKYINSVLISVNSEKFQVDDIDYEEIDPLSPDDMVKVSYDQWERECEALLEDTENLDL